jgi:hypothetical protein
MEFLGELTPEMLAADSEALKAIPKGEQLAVLGDLGATQLELEEKIAELEKELKAYQGKLDEVSEVKIPELMDILGIVEFKLTNGIKLSVKPYYSGKITSPEAIKWLEESGHEDIIKGSVTIPFPKGFDKESLRVFEAAAKAIGLTADVREEVHSSTLRAWIREMVEGGQAFPRDLFNVYVGKRTKLSLR